MKTGMFGGSFNPIHNGHTELAKALFRELELDRLLIMPSYIPPHKFVDSAAFPDQRFEMCCLAAKDIEGFEVSNLEIKRQGASYTFLTLHELHSIYPDDELYLLMGADMFMTLQKWKNPEIIFSLATMCAVPRYDDDISRLEQQARSLQEMGAKTRVLDARVMTVSSTQIRKMVRAGEDISGLVAPAVQKYIKEHYLYLR